MMSITSLSNIQHDIYRQKVHKYYTVRAEMGQRWAAMWLGYKSTRLNQNSSKGNSST